MVYGMGGSAECDSCDGCSCTIRPNLVTLLRENSYSTVYLLTLVPIVVATTDVQIAHAGSGTYKAGAALEAADAYPTYKRANLAMVVGTKYEDWN